MKYLILGGTGTLGKELTRRLLEDKDAKITCLSRCELKQKETEKHFANHPRLKFVIGDIRDKESLYDHFEGVHTIFHVAALKHVDSMESNPEESIKTNVLGTMNVADVAIRCKVPYVVFSSTDKAVDPINVYGMSKGLSEKILFNKNRIQTETKFSVYRWGNVLGSRGSVLDYFAKTLTEERMAYITDHDMTRFWIRIESAVDFILSTYKIAYAQKAMIPKMKAANIIDLAVAVDSALGLKDKVRFKSVGIRPGEKIHEDLVSRHDPEAMNSGTCDRYTPDELVDLVYPLVVRK